MKAGKYIALTALSLSLLSPILLAHSFERQEKVATVEASASDFYSEIQQSTINAGGATLQSALRSLINKHYNQLSYDELIAAYLSTDLVPGTTNKIWDMYGGIQFDKSKSSGNNGYVGGMYNKEHSIPKSWFGGKNKYPMYSDIVHVIPADAYVNNARGNFPLGNVGTLKKDFPFEEAKDGYGNVIQTAGISKVGTSKDDATLTVFEPDDQYKGDLARIYYYFATKYQGTATVTENGQSTFTSTYPYMTSYALKVFKKWHEEDPVSQKEIDRNDGIEKEQGMRNPFVDHPEWTNSIFGTAYNAEPADPDSVVFNDNTEKIQIDTYHQFQASVLPWNADQDITWSSDNSDIIEITENGYAYGKALGTATITATSVVDSTKSVSREIEVTEESVDPIDPVGPDSDIVSISYEDLPTSYQTGTLTKGGVTFKYNNFSNMNGTGHIQMKSSSGYVYNETAMTNVKSITLNTSTTSNKNCAVTIYFGNTANPTTNSVAATDGNTYDFPEGCEYFKILCGDHASYLSSIEFLFDIEESGEETPKELILSDVVDEYEIGDEFIKPTVTLTYEDSDKTLDVTELVTVTGFDSSKEDVIEVTISYGGLSKTINVVIESPDEPIDPDPEDPPVNPDPVEPPVDPDPVEPGEDEQTKIPVELEITNLKSRYKVGETFVRPTITVIYDDESTKDVTLLVTITVIDMSKAGNYPVTFSYTENEVTISTTRRVIIELDSSFTPTTNITSDTSDGKGCSGNVVATSLILSTISLVGISLLLLKKKHR